MFPGGDDNYQRRIGQGHSCQGWGGVENSTCEDMEA